VGNRCAVNLDCLRLPISREKIIALLNLKGFILLNVDMIALARECLEKSRYRRGARLFEATLIVDCSSLMKWLYAQRGIWLPRRSIQQREVGEAVGLNEIMAGDLVFVSGWIDYYYDDPANGVGHVGMATGDNTVIHDSNSETNITESPLEKFIGGENKFRGARRYIPDGVEVLTLETPAGREVEIADDIRWIILQSLPK
jgi:hypothetical protein